MKFDQKTQRTISSLKQFRAAVALAKEHFPGMTHLAFNLKQRNAIARLIQIIMCGVQEVEKHPMPADPACFLIKELQEVPAITIPDQSKRISNFFLPIWIPLRTQAKN